MKDWDIKINFGIKTGYNQAFIIDLSKEELNKVCTKLVAFADLYQRMVGFFKFDLVEAIFGGMSVISRIVYALV